MFGNLKTFKSLDFSFLYFLWDEIAIRHPTSISLETGIEIIMLIGYTYFTIHRGLTLCMQAQMHIFIPTIWISVFRKLHLDHSYFVASIGFCYNI